MGGVFGPLIPLLPPVPRLYLVQQMDRGGRSVTPQPFGESSSSPTQPRQRVKKDSLMLLVAALAPLLCCVTPGSEVRAQLWPRNRWRHAAGERWPGETVPSPPATDAAGVSDRFLCLSALRPFLRVTGPVRSYPFTNAHQETQGLKSVGPEGFQKTVSFL